MAVRSKGRFQMKSEPKKSFNSGVGGGWQQRCSTTVTKAIEVCSKGRSPIVLIFMPLDPDFPSAKNSVWLPVSPL